FRIRNPTSPVTETVTRARIDLPRRWARRPSRLKNAGGRDSTPERSEVANGRTLRQNCAKRSGRDPTPERQRGRERADASAKLREAKRTGPDARASARSRTGGRFGKTARSEADGTRRPSVSEVAEDRTPRHV